MKLSSGVTGMRCVVGVHEMSDVEICRKEKPRFLDRVQVNHFYLKKVPHRNVGSSKRAKVLSYPKGKLGRVHSRSVNTNTHTF